MSLQVSDPLFLPLLHVGDTSLHPYLDFLQLLHTQIHLLILYFLFLLQVEVFHGQVLIILLLGLLGQDLFIFLILIQFLPSVLIVLLPFMSIGVFQSN